MKLEDIAFLDVPLVVLMHDRISLSHGTALGVREPHTLAALVEGPKANAENGYLTNIAQVAASYAFGLATTQCFFDGAKRTAVLAMKSFLGANGYDLTLEVGHWESIILAVANKNMTRDALACEIAAEMGRCRSASGPVWCDIEID